MNAIARVLALCCLAAAPALAGNLTPPAGPPDSTMKPLDVVEPRIAITQADIPLVITQPGSYYLAGNVAAAPGQDAIVIDADHVTLDLEGFTITGAGTIANSAVLIGSNRLNAVVRNGTITNAYYGVFADFARNGRLENLVIADAPPINNNAAGVVCGSGFRIRQCEVRGYSLLNLHFGIRTSGNSVRTGILIEDCVITDCSTGVSISFCRNSLVRGCLVTGSSTRAIILAPLSTDVTVADCQVSGSAIGIEIFAGVTGCAVVRNFASGNTTNFVNVPNVSVNPATATPLDNLSY